ncbi:cytochrome c oxidase subunit II [Puia sp. P3]|uniref:cytochrome c oxidase subunit II n=1 Tax=Puia sp. P3 TaxID=3423952 RepID=UPI003D675119
MNIPLPPMFHPSSPEGSLIGKLGNGFLIAATAVTILVIGLTIGIIRKYRQSKNDGEPSQTPGNRRLEIPMIGVPLLLVTVFFAWSMRTMNAVQPGAGDHPPDVIITGHQWYWEVVYPSASVITANEVHLPVGRRLLLQLNSGDVIHDWWVPALGGKMDMIPGTDNHLWLTIRDTGVFDGACSEFCGQQHAWMRIKVIAQPPEQFDRWLASQSAPAQAPAGRFAGFGQSLFLSASCASCHRIKGTGANGRAGPDLTHLAERGTLLAGRMVNDSANLVAWLTDPQKIKPGARMPRFILARDSIDALAAYLTHLQ